MYKPKFADFVSTDQYHALEEKVAQRHPHFVVLIPPDRKPVAVVFKDNRDLLSWCDLFWDKYPTGTIRIPEHEDERMGVLLEMIDADNIPEL